MGLSISVTITTTDGEKPTFNVNADWDTHLADFNLTVTAADGTTTIVPSVNFDKVSPPKV
jgi:hypothetical protein